MERSGIMNYAYRTNSTFCVTRDISKLGKISEDVIKRRKYIRSHNFSVLENKDGEVTLSVSEKESDHE